MVLLKSTYSPASDEQSIEFYPNVYAKKRGEYPNGDGSNDNPVMCRQCNYPIMDRNNVTTCPNCASDNFD